VQSAKLTIKRYSLAKTKEQLMEFVSLKLREKDAKGKINNAK